VTRDRRPTSMTRWLERLLIVAASLAIAIGVIALLSGGLLAGHDSPGISGADSGPGVQYRDQGDAQLRPGERTPVYDSDPPTSGPHVPSPIEANGAQLTDDQLLQGLEVGDVVLMYGTKRPPPGLAGLAASLAPPFTPALAASGGAVVLAYRPGTTGVIALAWTHMLHVTSADDPSLRPFVQFWLGRGAPRTLH
jgi:Protein of unknown function (DUF3105)